MSSIASNSTPAPAPDPVIHGVVAFVPAGRILVIGGTDRLRFLQAVTAQDVGDLVPGEGVYGALTDDRGRPLSDFRLYVLPEVVLLELPAGRSEAARAALERLIIADEMITAWAEGETVAYEAADPERLAATLLAAREGRFAPPGAVLAETAPGVGYAEPGTGGGPLDDPAVLALLPRRRQVVLRASRLGGHGALHWSRAGSGEELDRLVARRDPAVKLARSAEERDPLEIEAGVIGEPELAEARVWNELDRMDAVSLTKGCWMGQEIVRRVHVLGEIKRRLAGVALDTPDTRGWAGATLSIGEGAPAGIVTRAAHSVSLGRAVGLAFVPRAAWAPGSALVAARKDGTRVAATTTALPFVRRSERSPGTPARPAPPVETP